MMSFIKMLTASGIIVIYEIKAGERSIGTTKFEFGDPPMGFVHGEFIPSEQYCSRNSYEELVVICADTDELISCVSVSIEDNSDKAGKQDVHITALLSSFEEYEKYFRHHINKYDASHK